MLTGAPTCRAPSHAVTHIIFETPKQWVRHIARQKDLLNCLYIFDKAAGDFATKRDLMKASTRNILLIGLTLIAFGATLPGDAQARKAKKEKAQGTFRLIAPALIPGTRPEMNSPGFWIGRHPSPDKVILDARGIQELNAKIRNELKISYDLTTYPAIHLGSDLAAAILRDQSRVRQWRFFTNEGTLPARHSWKVTLPIRTSARLPQRSGSVSD